MNDVVHGSDLSQREKRLLFWASFLSLAAAGGEHEGDGRSGCEQGVVAGPGCVLGQQIRAERPASRARGGGLTGACQGRIGVVVGFGWAGPQLEPPRHPKTVLLSFCVRLRQRVLVG